MKRRDFLKVLVAVGVVSITGVDSFNEKLPEFNDYPNITYMKDYITDKGCYLHQIRFTNNKSEQWAVSDFSFDEELNPELVANMLKEAHRVGLVS